MVRLRVINKYHQRMLDSKKGTYHQRRLRMPHHEGQIALRMSDYFVLLCLYLYITLNIISKNGFTMHSIGL